MPAYVTLGITYTSSAELSSSQCIYLVQIVSREKNGSFTLKKMGEGLREKVGSLLRPESMLMLLREINLTE